MIFTHEFTHRFVCFSYTKSRLLCGGCHSGLHPGRKVAGSAIQDKGTNKPGQKQTSPPEVEAGKQGRELFLQAWSDAVEVLLLEH